jgi:hypothetical protein
LHVLHPEERVVLLPEQSHGRGRDRGPGQHVRRREQLEP